MQKNHDLSLYSDILNDKEKKYNEFDLAAVTIFIDSVREEHGYYPILKQWLATIDSYQFELNTSSQYANQEELAKIPELFKELSVEQRSLLKLLLKKVDEKRIENITREVPSDLDQARRLSESGSYVDIKRLNLDLSEELLRNMQFYYDYTAETMGSDEYIAFKKEIEDQLEGITDQHFIFDIERTVMLTATSNSKERGEEEAHFILPWMHALITIVVANGNSVGFWTATTKERADDLKEAMPPELENLPTITVEDWQIILDMIKSIIKKEILGEETTDSDFDAIHAFIKEIYPIADSGRLDLYNAMLNVVEGDLDLDDFEEYISDLEPRYLKLPQAFTSKDRGIFIDDYKGYKEAAVFRGWPENRFITCDGMPGKQNILDIARMIKDAVEDNV